MYFVFDYTTVAGSPIHQMLSPLISRQLTNQKCLVLRPISVSVESTRPSRALRGVKQIFPIPMSMQPTVKTLSPKISYSWGQLLWGIYDPRSLH